MIGFTNPGLWSQNRKIDSLEAYLQLTSDPLEKGRVLLEISDAYRMVDLNKVQAYIRRAEAIPEFVKKQSNALKIEYQLAVLASRQNKLDSAILILNGILDHTA